MKTSTLAVFVVSVAVAALAATHRFQDSAHVISQLGVPGGRGARHPAMLDPAASAYTLIITSRVAPSFAGDARMVLEGAAGFESEIHLTAPIVPLSWRRRPVQKDNVLHDLQPRDAIALWVRLRRVSAPGEHPPVGADESTAAACSHCEDHGDGVIAAAPPPAAAPKKSWKGTGLGAESAALSPAQLPATDAPARREAGRDSAGTSLAFYDLKTDRLLLRVPIAFKEREDASHAH